MFFLGHVVSEGQAIILRGGYRRSLYCHLQKYFDNVMKGYIAYMYTLTPDSSCRTLFSVHTPERASPEPRSLRPSRRASALPRSLLLSKSPPRDPPVEGKETTLSIDIKILRSPREQPLESRQDWRMMINNPRGWVWWWEVTTGKFLQYLAAYVLGRPP